MAITVPALVLISVGLRYAGVLSSPQLNKSGCSRLNCAVGPGDRDPIRAVHAGLRTNGDAGRGWPAVKGALVANLEDKVLGGRSAGQPGNIDHNAINTAAIAGVISETCAAARQ